MSRMDRRSIPVDADRCGSPPDEDEMRGILLWLLGIPIPIIIALYLFGVI